jgi:hypothetical protein
MDYPKRIIPGFGEVGVDSEASPGNGSYYVKVYDGSYDSCGFDTEDEAYAELVAMREELRDAIQAMRLADSRIE